MTSKECYAVLGLKEGADMADIKRAYRRLAFSLHPDLNPDVPDAVKHFQRLNEAYVELTHAAESASRAHKAGGGQDEASARAREEARKAYKARQGKDSAARGDRARSEDRPREEVLKDILNDPFARRVFEDIYSHIKEGGGSSGSSADENEAAASGAGRRIGAKSAFRRKQGAPLAQMEGVMGKVKGWLKKQIDDEQVLRLPGESLVPGARVRLEIQHGLNEKPQVVELTLPPGFVPGKAMRLKGMGRRLGAWRGDLYVRIEAI